MKLQRFATVLTGINLVLLMFVLVQARSSVAQGVAPAIRGRALEIVDGQGRVRQASWCIPKSQPRAGRTPGRTRTR